MNVICFGDSNTFGHDPRSPLGERYPADSRWVDLLAAKTAWNIKNEGMNGREIPRAAVSFPDSTDLLLVMLGTNDLLRGASVEEVVRRMGVFLGSLTLPRQRILLLAPPPMKLGDWVSEDRLVSDAECLAASLRALAGSLGIRFADAGRPAVPLAFDGVHFTPEGHRLFATRLCELLEVL